MAVVGWTTDTARIMVRTFEPQLADVQRALHAFMDGDQPKAFPAEEGGDWARHVLREGNKDADLQAGMATGDD